MKWTSFWLSVAVMSVGAGCGKKPSATVEGLLRAVQGNQPTSGYFTLKAAQYGSPVKGITRFAMKKDAPTDDELLAVMLGPTGNLRAPTIRHGATLLVGFDEDVYMETL